MNEVRIGPITTECYKPHVEDRSFATNFQLGRITRGFFGRDALALCRGMSMGMTLSAKETEEINNHFLKSSSRIYSLPNSTDPQSFYRERKKDAIGVIQYFGKLVPELAEDLELRDEITNLSDRPSDLLRYLADPSGVDSSLAYEAQRHAILHYQLGMIEARALNAGLCNLLYDVQDLLNQQLFEGLEGSGQQIFLESYHDDETNRVIGFPDRNDQRPLTAHLKRQRIVVREIPGIGYVHKKPNAKELGPTIAKSWVKADNNGGTVHIDNAIQDSIRMKLVLMDDSVSPKQLADLVVSVIKSGIKSRLESDHPRKIPRVVKVEKDNKTQRDHGQSVKINLNARRKIWFKGIPTPFEMIFYDRETYLNSTLEVGRRDSKTGLYLGRAHELFELRRGRQIVRIPFPEEIYPVSEEDLNRAFVNRSKQEAHRLINMYKQPSCV